MLKGKKKKEKKRIIGVVLNTPKVFLKARF
jgi:hypothetical protein